MDVFQDLEGYDLPSILIVSKVTVQPNSTSGAYQGVAFPGLSVDVAPATAPKCIRCWCHHEDVGKDEAHPELCPRCAAVVRAGEFS